MTADPITEVRTIAVVVFRDPQYNMPACSIGVSSASTCPLLRERKYGSIYECAWSGEELYRRTPGVQALLGYIRPDDKCPLWRKTETALEEIQK